jgi:hypothetical protein
LGSEYFVLKWRLDERIKLILAFRKN